MLTRFDCPHCDKTLQASEDKAGVRFACPKCKQQVTVPPPIPSMKRGGAAVGQRAVPSGQKKFGTFAWVGIGGGGVLLAAVIGVLFWAFGRGSNPANQDKGKANDLAAAKAKSEEGPTAASSQKAPNLDGTPGSGRAEGPKSDPIRRNPIVLMKTSMGDIRLELFADKAPKTVANFLSYAEDGFYDGMILHRVVPNFTIQGGGFEPGLREKKPTRPPIPSESDNGLSNVFGSLAMARAGGADSATTQFFFNVNDNSRILDRGKAKDGVGYCVFGRVVSGLDVLDEIKVVQTGNRNGQSNVPIQDVRIVTIRRE